MAQVIPIHEPESVSLVREGSAIKAQIDVSQARLKEINARLAEIAEYKPGAKTGMVIGSGVQAKVQLKEYEKWDQEKLEQARALLGDELFFRLFRWEFSPRSKRELDGFLGFAPENHRRAVLDALTVKPGAPYVTYERMEA